MSSVGRRYSSFVDNLPDGCAKVLKCEVDRGPMLIPKVSDDSLNGQNEDMEFGDRDKLSPDFLLTLEDPLMRVTCLDRVNTFRFNRELIDVILYVGGKEIAGHKVVLAALSPSLFEMFQSQCLNDSTSRFNAQSPPPNSVQKSTNSSKSSVDSMSPVPPVTNTGGSTCYEYPHGDFDCFNAIVTFAYTGILEINSKKIAELYKTAHFLRIERIAKACASYMSQNLTISNCIGIRRQANFNDESFVKKVDEFIVDNFKKIVNENSPKLPCIKLRIVVNLDNNDCAMETSDGENLVERALQYFQSIPNKGNHAEQIIEQLTEKSHILYIENSEGLQDASVVNENTSLGQTQLIKDYKRIKDQKNRSNNEIPASNSQHHITGATSLNLNGSRIMNNLYSSNDSINSISSHNTECDEEIESKVIAMQQRACASGKVLIALVVLHKRLVMLSVYVTTYDQLVKLSENMFPAETRKHIVQQQSVDQHDNDLSPLNASALDQLTPIPMMFHARCSVGAVYINERIIVCGGYDRGECLKCVEEYDLVRKEWRELPDMIFERGRFDACAANGKLYAVAGCNGNVDLKSVECYDLEMQKWSLVAPVLIARSNNGCAYLNGLIYCIGGCLEQEILRVCERYDPNKDQWERIHPMQVPRCQAGCTSWRGLIVACGGCDRWNCIDTVEAYDPETESWKYLAKLQTARRGCGVAVVRDSLYVIGGHDGTNSLQSVEILDSISGQWRTGPSLNIARANTHAVVVENSIHIIGGFDGSKFLSSIEILEHGLEVQAGRDGFTMIRRKYKHCVDDDSKLIPAVYTFMKTTFVGR